MMPSSVNVGVRPSIATSRSYSSLLRPCSATSAGVIAGSPGRGATAATLRRHAGEDRLQKTDSILGAEERAARALRMRHQPEHVALLVDDPGDVALGAVGIGVRADISAGVRIPEDNPVAGFQCVENLRRGVIAAVAVGDGNLQHFGALVEVGEQRVVVLHPQEHRSRNELKARIPHQGAGKEVRLTQNLKSVAHSEHRPACLGVRRYFLHYRAETSDRPGAKIVAVAEAPGENDHVRILKVVILVPEVNRFFAKDLRYGVVRIVIAVGAGEGDDTELHAGTADSTSKSSVTGFASSFRHISFTLSPAASASSALVSMRM